MALDADEIIDRRRMRRRIAFWRVAAFLLLAGFIVALAGAGGAFRGLGGKGSDHIARVSIDGFIGDDRKLRELFEELAKKDRVKAVILDVNSPGGSTVGGEATYEAVRRLAQKKPVVASVGTLGASAAYMIACGAERIVARQSSIVGSIGVLFQYGDFSTLLDKVGVSVEAVKSAPLKAEPSPFHPATEEARQMIARIVDDSYDRFVDLVAERRAMERTRALALADGSIYTGAQGLENGLVDAIGGEEAAKDWLVEAKGLDPDVEIVEWKPKSDDGGVLGSRSVSEILTKAILDGKETVTLSQLQDIVRKTLIIDGLVSVMQTPGIDTGSVRR